MRGFFSRPYEFSFKDLLAIGFSSTFLYFCWQAMTNKDVLDLVKTLVPLISIILAGYFGQEAIETWRNGKRVVNNASDNRNEPPI